MEAPTPQDVRRTLAHFDDHQQKIIAGMLTAMIQNPQQVRDREWIARQLAEITLLAGEFEADTPQDGVRVVQDYLTANAVELLNASYLLFQRVGLDFAPRASAGFTLEEALRSGFEYLPSFQDTESKKSPVARDLGEQPLAQLMAERELKPSDLVAASSEQLTHKMVTRAMKGRRLTANTMGKVCRAWEQATSSTHAQSDLFNYEP